MDKEPARKLFVVGQHSSDPSKWIDGYHALVIARDAQEAIGLAEHFGFAAEVSLANSAVLTFPS